MDRAGDAWDWEVLPDHRSSSSTSSHGDGSKNLGDDQETMEPAAAILPSGDAAASDDECKDIGVVPEETQTMPVAAVDVLTVPDVPDEEEEVFKAPDAKEADDGSHPLQLSEEEEDLKKELGDEEEDLKKEHGEEAPPECVVFSIGKLKVNGIGALCSFGVAAAATACIFLIGGRLQHHHRQQQHKIQLQLYGDDKRIQQAVQQTSRLNQAMSSVMGAGASTRANISFGGFYDGF